MYSLIDRSQSDVVIQKLTELHQHESVARVQVGHVSVDNNGHKSGGGQGLVAHRPESRPGDCWKKQLCELN